MKVVIIGAGEVGFHVAKALSEENYDITVVDIDPEKCQRASESLDVIVVEGNGASPNVLLDATGHNGYRAERPHLHSQGITPLRHNALKA